MNFQGSEKSSSALELQDDFLIKQIALTHDPDGRHIDTELLLRAMETIISYATMSQVSDQHVAAIADFEVVGSEESLVHTIYKLSSEILCSYPVRGNSSHQMAMKLLEMLGQYKWDAKAVLVLSAFATRYGEFWLIMQLYPSNPLAASIALIKQLPNDLSLFKPRFKSLSALTKTIIDVTKCIIRFQGLPLRRVALENDAAFMVAKSRIYITTYWVIRSAVACFSQITDLIGLKNTQVHVPSHLQSTHSHSSSEISASWELSSLVCKLSTVSHHLKRQVDLCYQLIETKMHKRLLDRFNEPQTDNQEVLDMLLFAPHNDLPLMDRSTKAKIGLSELKNKVVILLVSNPELLPIEVFLLLVQQMHDHPERLILEGKYEILWIAIPSSDTWTYTEEQSFEFLSKSLPWYTIGQPRSLSPIVVKFIQQEWNFKKDPLMVVLDSQGKITNSNAFDMAMVWGSKAYPFSISRENELWREETWNFQLLLDQIDPLVAKWVEEDQNLCIYGSNNLDWTKEFTDKMQGIINSGLQLTMVYLGHRTPSEQVRSIFYTIRDEKLTSSLTFTKIKFFWHRLDSMRRSKHRLGCTGDNDQILKQLLELMDAGENEKGWVLLGRGGSNTDVLRLQGREEVMGCLDLFQEWGENVAVLGLVGAIRNAIEQPKPLLAEPCNHADIIPFVEGLKETVICAKCKRTLEKFVVYQCKHAM